MDGSIRTTTFPFHIIGVDKILIKRAIKGLFPGYAWFPPWFFNCHSISWQVSELWGFRAWTESDQARIMKDFFNRLKQHKSNSCECFSLWSQDLVLRLPDVLERLFLWGKNKEGQNKTWFTYSFSVFFLQRQTNKQRFASFKTRSKPSFTFQMFFRTYKADSTSGDHACMISAR